MEIVTNISVSGHPVYGDEGTLTEALSNIVYNALKYSYADSKVIIQVSESEGNVFISVADSGIGISPEDIPFGIRMGLVLIA